MRELFFFQILDFGFVCHAIRNNTERDTIYFCKVRRRMNRSNNLLLSLKTEIFRTELGEISMIEHPAFQAISEVEKDSIYLISVYTGNYCYYYCYCFLKFIYTSYFHKSLFCSEFLDFGFIHQTIRILNSETLHFSKVSSLKKLIHLYSISLNPDIFLK